MKFLLAPIGMAILLLGPLPAMAENLSEARIKELVYEAIRENPGIVMEAVELLQAQEAEQQAAAASQVLSAHRDTLENDPNAPVLGNPEGDVTVIEFFDYNCPYCKRVAPEVKAIMADDANIRVVYREWPILGEGSVFAARAALASRKQGKYEAFHWALMDLKGRADEASVLRAAEEVGLDVNQLREDMEAPEVDEHIATSMALTQTLGFDGTPSFVIGEALVPGFIEQSQLAELVSQARTGN
ncbi:DsbA family protein [Tropicimonas sp. IMCC6043]|uniref:DsbA family protein n=1 Tax=Tropicimonas sp. IMCC6043 TaxID=2510645 RepID=UPI00101D3A5F|nr:DsbA family protein [Tropicimonas sp. IMCC6043]RYH05999.1 DsbA family protein [Tropicimonas sp. IMCC6043]